MWNSADALAAVGFKINGTSGTDLERKGLIVEGTLTTPTHDGAVLDNLSATVRDTIAELPPIRGTIRTDDVHIDISDEPPSNLLVLRTSPATDEDSPRQIDGNN